MAKYVDGFVFVVPNKNFAAYKKMARQGATAWKKHGALLYMECMGEDMKPKMPPGIKHQVFPTLAKAKRGETVWFSFIVFKSRKHRDEVNAKVMAEMEKKMANYKDFAMPFDMKRFTYGGFDVVVE